LKTKGANGKTKGERDDHDSPWKEILEARFLDFLDFFFPEVRREMDERRDWRFLDTELRRITADARLGGRRVDKLAAIPLRDGSEQWVMFHVEIQGTPERHFDERMFVYNYRIYDRFRHTVASFAVLADTSPSWRPSGFRYGRWGCRVAMEYPSVKLLDYADRWDELERDPNPFALVVRAHLKTVATRKDLGERLRWKSVLCKELYRRGYGRLDVLHFFRFLDWLMRLPEEADRLFWEDFQRFEKECRMPYVTSVERLGRQEGRIEGKIEGRTETLRDNVRKLLVKGIPPSQVAYLLEVDDALVDEVARGIEGEK